MTITIDIADELLKEQSINPKIVKEQIALMLYEKKLLTSFQVCEMLGINKWDFFVLMQQHNVPINYDESDLEQDLKVLDNIFPKIKK